jgi:hypothetical protein
MKQKSHENDCTIGVWGNDRQPDAEQPELRGCLAYPPGAAGGLRRTAKQHKGLENEFLRRCPGFKRHNSIGGFESIFPRLRGHTLSRVSRKPMPQSAINSRSLSLQLFPAQAGALSWSLV